MNMRDGCGKVHFPAEVVHTSDELEYSKCVSNKLYTDEQQVCVDVRKSLKWSLGLLSTMPNPIRVGAQHYRLCYLVSSI